MHYGEVSSVDLLFQNFYQLSQEKGEKVQTFAVRLEGCLNQLCLCFPHMIAELDVNRQLKEWLFYEMVKPLGDSVRYLYDNPSMSYMQLMISTHKADSKVVAHKCTVQDWAKLAIVDSTNSSTEVDNLQKQIANLKTLDREWG